MHDFLASVAPEPFWVFCVRLKPLTFGHVVLMERLGLDSAKPEDIPLAVQICSRSYRDALRYVDRLFSFVGRFESLVFRFRIYLCNPHGAIEAWADYWEENTGHPETVETEDSGSNRGAPLMLQVRVRLLERCGYSADTIWDQPWSQCLWDYAASWEASNGFGIVGEKHREISRILNN